MVSLVGRLYATNCYNCRKSLGSGCLCGFLLLLLSLLLTGCHGKQVSRQLVKELDSTAIDRIVEYGTAPKGPEAVVEVITNPDGSGILVLESGSTLEFSASKAMTATAYTAGHDKAGYITALGTDLHVGIVAVDKKVIPLRTKVYVVTKGGIVYGPAVAEDTGVRGDVIDLYMDSYSECITFGRRSCTVYILK